MKTVVITGANAGIGYHAALHFARGGARVVMACRNLEKAALAARAIQADVPAAVVEVLPLDVSELASVREFARAFAERVGTLDVLINNAGIAAQPLARNSAGHELQLATNYLGVFALTGLLLPYFDARARVVNVSSIAHHISALRTDDLNWNTRAYDQWQAYANSKAAVLSHAFELQRRLRQRGSQVLALGAHPGFAATEILYKSESLRPKTAFSRWRMKVTTPLIPTAEKAAQSVIHAAIHGAGGEYYGPQLGVAGKPGRARPSASSRDATLAAALWAISQELTGVRYL